MASSHSGLRPKLQLARAQRDQTLAVAQLDANGLADDTLFAYRIILIGRRGRFADSHG